MENTSMLPIEVAIQRAKRDIAVAINQIGRQYELPSSILLLIVDDILNSTRNSTYTSIINNYDILAPKTVEKSDIKTQTIENDTDE